MFGLKGDAPQQLKLLPRKQHWSTRMVYFFSAPV